MKKKLIISMIILPLVIIAITSIYFILNKQDENTTLTIMEKKWIESNKNQIIDFNILNNIAILNYEGEGLFFDFIQSFQSTTGLDFNEVSYQYGTTPNAAYSFRVTKQVSDKDILVYSDNYVLISKDNIKYNRVEEIQDLTIGVLSDDATNISTYINNDTLTYKTYSTISDLLLEINKDDSEIEIDAIILPKLIFLSNLKEYDDLKINYNITEMQDNYVISLGNTDKLNEILKKFYKKWVSENYDEMFAKHFTNTYFTIREIDEQSKVKFRSKRYIYAFLNNSPFDKNSDNKLVGINSTIIKDFSTLTNVEVIYKEYQNYDKLIQEFNANNIDFFSDMYKPTSYKMDTFQTVSIYDEQIVIASSLKNKTVINSINSLRGKEIAVIASTKIEAYLKELGVYIRTYNDVDELLKNINDETLIALDYHTYNYYLRNQLANYKIDYQFPLDTDYTYIVRDIKDNEIFKDFFNYYLGFINEKPIISAGYSLTLNNTSGFNMIRNLIIISLLILLGIVIFFIVKVKPKKKKKSVMRKEDKLRYIDMLTSLKNRSFLNDNIEKWDNSEIYPQTIIIIDLNNIAYINDNYGHEEGDNVIKEAANILINNQISNTEIIRTDGNEFLVYLVSYDEKQIVSYIRKLSKEFKELSHGFGAALGYSIINDAIKTIDDAINEATLDMRSNKEELNN